MHHDDWNARNKAVIEEDITTIFDDHGNKAQTQEIEDDPVQSSQLHKRSCRGQYLNTLGAYIKNTVDLKNMRTPEKKLTKNSNR